MEIERPAIPRIVSACAAPQAGCASRRELLAAGVTKGEIGSLLRREALIPILPGTYGYGLAQLTQQSLWWAAVLYAGDGARLAYRSALEVQGVLPPDPEQATVVIPRRRGSGRRTLQTKLALPGGEPADVLVVPSERERGSCRVGALWSDTALQAIFDLAGAGNDKELRKAWREADYRGLLHADELRGHLLAAAPGSGVVRTLLAEIPIVGEGTTLLSRAERRLLEALTAGGLRPSHVNELIAFGVRTIRPDFWWLLAQLIVEVDGPGHLLPSRRAEDIERDAHVAATGAAVLRFSDDDVWRDVAGCVQVIRSRLAERLGIAAERVPERLVRPV